MAYVGELVKMSDGRWARFQRYEAMDASGSSTSMLIAVELAPEYQRMLDDAQGEYWGGGQPSPVRMSLDADESGKFSLQVIEQAALQ